MSDVIVITLRPTTPVDVPLLQQAHVIAAEPNDDLDWKTQLARTPAWWEQLMTELGDRPIGFVQIIDPVQEESEYQGNVPTNLRAIDSWNLYTIVDEIDQHQAMAIAAGAEIVNDIQDQDYGDRDYSCQDPEGYLWNFGIYVPGAPRHRPT